VLSEFVSWAKEFGAASHQEAARVTVTIGEASSNPSARMDIDTADKIGRVTFWQSGDFYAEILACDSGEMLYSNHGVSVPEKPFAECFQPFLLKLGVSAQIKQIP